MVLLQVSSIAHNACTCGEGGTANTGGTGFAEICTDIYSCQLSVVLILTLFIIVYIYGGAGGIADSVGGH